MSSDVLFVSYIVSSFYICLAIFGREVEVILEGADDNSTYWINNANNGILLKCYVS